MQRNDAGLFIGMHPLFGIGIITYFDEAHIRGKIWQGKKHSDPKMF